MKKIGFLTIFILIILSMQIITAVPCIFHGKIKINGNLSELNTTSVIAYLNNSGELIQADFSYPNQDLDSGKYGIQVENNTEIFFKINKHFVNEGSQLCEAQGESNWINLNLSLTITNFEGNSSDVKTNLENSEMEVGGSDDLDQAFFGTQEVVIKENGTDRVIFNHDFDSGVLNLTTINITKQSNTSTKGSIIISGINLSSGETKTVYVDRIANTDYVCVLDEENAKVSEMTSDCSGNNEIAVKCDGNDYSGYTCTFVENNTRLKITGLTHSAVAESDYTAPTTTSTTTTSSSSGGGGGGGSSSYEPIECTENWTCTDWSVCGEDRVQTRICTDLNACGTILEKPEIAKMCDYQQLSSPLEEDNTQQQTESESNIEEPESSKGITGAVIGGVTSIKGIAIIIVIIIILSVLYIIYKKKKLKK